MDEYEYELFIGDESYGSFPRWADALREAAYWFTDDPEFDPDEPDMIVIEKMLVAVN